jgi:hypothetical protein
VTVFRYFVGTFFLIAFAVPPSSSATASCPATQPPAPAFQPPPDEMPHPADTAQWEARWFWYGTPQLWTQLHRDGHAGRRDKMFWWSAGYRASVEQRPNLVVTLNRIGSSVSTVVNEPATNAGFDGASSMLTLFEFPEPGCWQVTASYRGNRLAFVVDVP